jgi:hypothetical protein
MLTILDGFKILDRGFSIFISNQIFKTEFIEIVNSLILELLSVSQTVFRRHFFRLLLKLDLKFLY